MPTAPTRDLARQDRTTVTKAYREARAHARAELAVLPEVVGIQQAAQLATVHLMHAVARMAVLDQHPADPAVLDLLAVIADGDDDMLHKLLAASWNVPAETVADADASYDPDELGACTAGYEWQSARFDAYVAGVRPTLDTVLA